MSDISEKTHKRAYVITKTQRKKFLRMSPDRVEFFKSNSDGSISMREYSDRLNLLKARIKKFVKYHSFDEDVKNSLLEVLYLTPPCDIVTYSVPRSYLTLFK